MVNDAVGTIGGVFIDDEGRLVESDYNVVGLDYSGYQAASLNSSQKVILMCGGARRHRLVKAALKARLMSVLITSKETAEWVLDS